MDKKPFELDAPPWPDDYNLKATLGAVQDDLIKLLRERESIDWRISKLQSDIVHLAALCHIEVEDPIKQLGLTDAVRYILGKEKTPLTIQEMVEALSKSSYDVSEYKNISANLHTIVGRLIRSNEVRGMGQPGTPATFIWIGGIPPMPPAPDWLKKRLKDLQERIKKV